MSLSNEIKRIPTKEFWKRVGYWSALKWSGKKRDPISSDDWLPIMTSVLIGALLLFIFLWIRG